MHTGQYRNKPIWDDCLMRQEFVWRANRTAIGQSVWVAWNKWTKTLFYCQTTVGEAPPRWRYGFDSRSGHTENLKSGTYSVVLVVNGINKPCPFYHRLHAILTPNSEAKSPQSYAKSSTLQRSEKAEGNNAVRRLQLWLTVIVVFFSVLFFLCIRTSCVLCDLNLSVSYSEFLLTTKAFFQNARYDNT